jgi:hypothetical protein
MYTMLRILGKKWKKSDEVDTGTSLRNGEKKHS